MKLQTVFSLSMPRTSRAVPAALLAVTLVVSGCAGFGGRHGRGAGPEVVAGNQWTKFLEQKRQTLVASMTGTGIEVARTPSNELKLNVPGDFSFDAGRAVIKPQMMPVLDEIGRDLNSRVRVTVVGHADSAGTAAPNEPLSMDRAEAVREYLARRGVSRNRMAVEGSSVREPVVGSNLSAADRARNRRVEILLSEPAS